MQSSSAEYQELNEELERFLDGWSQRWRAVNTSVTASGPLPAEVADVRSEANSVVAKYSCLIARELYKHKLLNHAQLGGVVASFLGRDDFCTLRLVSAPMTATLSFFAEEAVLADLKRLYAIPVESADEMLKESHWHRLSWMPFFLDEASLSRSFKRNLLDATLLNGDKKSISHIIDSSQGVNETIIVFFVPMKRTYIRLPSLWFFYLNNLKAPKLKSFVVRPSLKNVLFNVPPWHKILPTDLEIKPTQPLHHVVVGNHNVSRIGRNFLYGIQSIEFVTPFAKLTHLPDNFLSGYKADRSPKFDAFFNVEGIGESFMWHCCCREVDCLGLSAVESIGSNFCGYSNNLQRLDISVFKKLKVFDYGLGGSCERLKECVCNGIGSSGPGLVIGGKFLEGTAIKRFETIEWQSVTQIGDCALDSCHDLEEVILRDMPGLIRIGEFFAQSCRNLKSFTARTVPTLKSQNVDRGFLYGSQETIRTLNLSGFTNFKECPFSLEAPKGATIIVSSGKTGESLTNECIAELENLERYELVDETIDD